MATNSICADSPASLQQALGDAALRSASHWTLRGSWVSNEHVRALPAHVACLVIDVRPDPNDRAGMWWFEPVRLRYGSLLGLRGLQTLVLRGVLLCRARRHARLPLLRRVEYDINLEAAPAWTAECEMVFSPPPAVGVLLWSTPPIEVVVAHPNR